MPAGNPRYQGGLTPAELHRLAGKQVWVVSSALPQVPAGGFEKILSMVNEEERTLLLWDEGCQPSKPDVEKVHWDFDQEAFVEGKGWYHRDENAVPRGYVLQPWEGYSYEAWR